MSSEKNWSRAVRYDFEEKDDKGVKTGTMAVEVFTDGLRFSVNPWGDSDESEGFSFFFRGDRKTVWNWLEALKQDVDDSMPCSETEECRWDKVGVSGGMDLLECVKPHKCENKLPKDQPALPGISA